MKLDNNNINILNDVKANVTPKPNIITQHTGDVTGLAYGCKVIQYVRDAKKVYVVSIENLTWMMGENETKDLLSSNGIAYTKDVTEFCLVSLHIIQLDKLLLADNIKRYNDNYTYNEEYMININNITDDNIISLAEELVEYTSRYLEDSAYKSGVRAITQYIKDNVYDSNALDRNITQYLKY